MLFSGNHKDIGPSLESIGAAFAIFEMPASEGVAVLASANTLFEEFSGKLVIECVGRSLSEIVPRYVEKPISECLLRCLKEQCPQEHELVVDREGGSRWWRLVASPVVQNPAGRAQRVISTLIEITEKKLLQQELDITRQRFEAVVQTAYDGVISIDEKQTIKLMNESARYIFGVSDNSVIGSNLSRFIPQRFRGKHPEYVSSFKTSTVDARPMESRVPVRGLRADGTEFPIEVTISKIKVGGETEMTAVIRDISERIRLIEELSRAASHDPLTGAYNRRHGLSALKAELARCLRFGHTMSLVMFDLDHFKAINDGYGHPCGDRVLSSVVERVVKILRDTDVFCRWGGEEFLILLPETSGKEALTLAERARAAIEAKPVAGCGDVAVPIAASFGVAGLGEKCEQPDAFIARVDRALYRAKDSGRNCCILDT